MQIAGVPFMTTDWSQVPSTEHQGATGVAHWRTVEQGNLRVRQVRVIASAWTCRSSA